MITVKAQTVFLRPNRLIAAKAVAFALQNKMADVKLF